MHHLMRHQTLHCTYVLRLVITQNAHCLPKQYHPTGTEHVHCEEINLYRQYNFDEGQSLKVCILGHINIIPIHFL
jgi:hypothetical protein